MDYRLCDLTYDDATHIYRHQGVVVPSVTQILNIVPPRSRLLSVMSMSAEKRAVLEHARDLGTAVHAACHYYDEGTLRHDSVSEEVTPYVQAWMRFVSESAFDIVGMETLVLHKTMGYAGRYDRKGHRRGTKRRVLLDIKTGDPRSAKASAQTAAYVQAELSQLGIYEPVERVSVQLHEDGSYTEHPHPLRTDFEFFRHALGIFNEEGKAA